MRKAIGAKVTHRVNFQTAVSALIAIVSLICFATPPSSAAPMAHGRAPLSRREADARVRMVNGFPHLFINGKLTPPLALFVRISIGNKPVLVQSAAEIRLAAAQGVNIITFPAPWVGPLPDARYPQGYQRLDRQCAFILKNNPHAWLLPRVWCGAAGFPASHPAQLVAYANGTHPMSCVASHLWYQSTARALTAFIKHIQRSKYADRIIGYHLTHGHTGEWFTPEYWRHPGFDYSEVNRKGFDRWLKRHYHIVSQLQKAWDNPTVSFKTAMIPAPEPFTAYPFYQPSQRPYVDYLNYQSDITADRIMQLAAVVKNLTDGRSLVVTFYGYDFELPTSDTSDRALGRLLRCKDIDAIASPVSYRDRGPGGSPAFMGPVDSATLHGKLWMLEDDTSTFLNKRNKNGVYPGTSVGHCANLHQTNVVHNRNFGQMMVHRLGTWWMDILGAGWLNNAGMWKDMGRMRKAYVKYGPRTEYEPEVAVIYDERSPSYARVEPGRVLPLYPALVNYPTEFFHCGTSVGFYLLSDIKEPNFPKSKVIIFLNAWHVGNAMRRVIREKLERGGRTLVWMYGAGFISKGKVDTTSASRLLGIKLRLRAAAGNLPASEIMAGNSIGLPVTTVAGLNGADAPSWVVADSKAIALAKYVRNGGVSIALKRFPGYQSLFVGDPRATAAFWRELLPHLGVHVYLDTNDAFQTDGRLMMISSNGVAGNRTIVLPQRGTVYDFLSGKVLAKHVRQFSLFLRRFQTVLLRVHEPQKSVPPDIKIKITTQ